MNAMYKMTLSRLENKKAELKSEQEYFATMCHNEMSTGNFERNAINMLLVMQQLKSEIAELERACEMCKAFNKVVE